MAKKEKPAPAAMSDAAFYSHEIEIELIQAREEGIDLGEYEQLIKAAAALPASEEKEKISDIIYDLILSAGTLGGCPFNEPSALPEIRALIGGGYPAVSPDGSLKNRIRGAWYGRIAGCLLGKPIEGIRTDELIPLLKETGNYPLHRYPLNSEMTDEVASKYKFPLKDRCYADNIACAPADDDTNYTVMAQQIIEKYGRAFTPENVLSSWVSMQPSTAYFTAERVAYLNYMRGYRPPDTATYKNHYREWIGAQIRGDYYGYINPGNPEAAADMAWRDASISHVKNGIYGEMFVAAMLARAAVSSEVTDVIECAMSFIPKTSRLFDRLSYVLEAYRTAASKEDVYSQIHTEYDEHTGYGWCHVIPNAMIVAASLLYGEGDWGRSVCLAVGAGFDTDCNGATVGSVLGMLLGFDAIGEKWIKPLNGRLETSIVGLGTLEIESLAEKTLAHCGL